MKKLLILIVILLIGTAATWLGASWFIGVKTEALVRQQLEQTDPNNPDLHLHPMHTLVDYQSTLFGAKVVTLMDVRDTPLSTWVDELQLIHEVKNGPLFWRGGFDNLQTGLSAWQTTVDMDFLAEDVREQVEAVFAGAEPLRMISLVDFERVAAYQVKLSPINTTTEYDEAFGLEGAVATGRFDVKDGVLNTFKLTTGLLAFVNDETSLSLPAVSIAKQASTDGQDELSFSANQVSLLIDSEPEAIVFNLAGKSAYQQQGNNDLAGDFKLNLSAFSGIQYPLQRLDFDFEYSGINAEGLTAVNRLQTRLQDLQAQLGWNEEEIETPEARRKITQLNIESEEVADHLLDTVFTKVLQEDQSRFTAAIKLDTENGDILNQTNLTYTGAAQRVSLQALMAYGLEDWAKLFRGKIELDAAQAALTDDAQLLLRYPIEKHAVIDEGERYLMDLRLVGSDVELNERVVAFSGLSGKFMPQAPAPDERLGTDISPAVLTMIEAKGLTPEVLQELEASNDVSASTLAMLRQFQEMSEQLK